MRYLVWLLHCLSLPRGFQGSEMDKHPLSLFTLVYWAGNLSSLTALLVFSHLFLSFLPFYSTSPELSRWISPSILQSDTTFTTLLVSCLLPSFCPFSYSFPLSISVCFKVQTCKESHREYPDCHCPRRGVLASFQGRGCLLAAWQLVNYCQQTECTEISRKTTQIWTASPWR